MLSTNPSAAATAAPQTPNRRLRWQSPSQLFTWLSVSVVRELLWKTCTLLWRKQSLTGTIFPSAYFSYPEMILAPHRDEMTFLRLFQLQNSEQKCTEKNMIKCLFSKCLYGRMKCHGPAGVPRLATRCLCLLSTWLVVCLVPCAPMSIVCPLPSCYVIIVSVAPAVSPSFVSLYSSPCVCSPVLIRCLSCVSCELNVWLCSSLLPACLFFPFGVVFVCSLFYFVIKETW